MAKNDGANNRRLFLGNLAYRATVQDIQNLFQAYGIQVQNVRIGTEPDTGRSRGFAFVDVDPAEPRSLNEIVAATNNSLICERLCNIEVARPREAARKPRHANETTTPAHRKRNKSAWLFPKFDGDY